MQAELKSEYPPYIPIRKGWPSHRSPAWLLAAIAVVALASAAVGISLKPTPSQRSADLAGFLKTINSDVASCAGGVRDSLYVLRAIDTGFSHNVGTAISVATTGAAACEPASNEILAALITEQPPQSLAGYHLDRVDKALTAWAATYGIAVEDDIATVLTDRGKPSEAAARAALKADLAKLDQQRALVSSLLAPAVKALKPKAALLALPG